MLPSGSAVEVTLGDLSHSFVPGFSHRAHSTLWTLGSRGLNVLAPAYFILTFFFKFKSSPSSHSFASIIAIYGGCKHRRFQDRNFSLTPQIEIHVEEYNAMAVYR